MDFLTALKEKVLIFDGAMGTAIHSYNLSLENDYKGLENCPEILVDSRPDIISQIHANYLQVGCDVIETNTFGGSSIVLNEFGIAERSYELNFKAAKLAKQIANDYSNKQKRFVSGSIGPTTKLPSLGHISFNDLKNSYSTQVAGLIDGGVDVLQFETGQDLLQAKAAISAIGEYLAKIGRHLPIIVQITIEAPPISTMLTGSDISSALTTLNSFPIDVIGINCATGPAEMIDPISYLCQNTNKAISVLPNAGLPENIAGKTVYKLSPDELAQSLHKFVNELGVNIVGGCCGTTPEHLEKVCKLIGNTKPKKRNVNEISAVASLYTSVPFKQDIAPLIVGERTNTNGSRKFKELLEKEDWDGMVAMARAQEKEGAHVLDVCTAYVGRDEIRDMSHYIKRLNTEIQIPLVVDTTEFSVLEKTLTLISGKPIVNSINLEDGENKMLAKVNLIKEYGAAVVALTIDETGMARKAKDKLAIAKRIYDLVTKAGIKASDIIFDALTFTLSTGNEEDRRLGMETLEGIRLIKEAMPEVHTILGVSNISFGFDASIRQKLNSVFLHYAVDAGLDMAIVNAQKIIPLYKIEEAEREFHRKLVFDERTKDYDPLFALLGYYKSKSNTKTSEKKTVVLEIEDALKQRIIDGNRVDLEKDLDKALKKHSPLDVINKILLDGMKVVGDLFGAGKMQLPFVLQSAETMKAAVKYLEQFMDRIEGVSRATMILATVKGDVHDIGKNLVDIILTNNGYKVINLGIKQPIENIISAAVEHKADCIGMSGLLVKSTVIMKENLEILNQRGINIPIILGGAALTRRYVEQDCRQVYKGILLYGQDAFDDLRYMEALGNGGKNNLLQFIEEKPIIEKCIDDEDIETEETISPIGNDKNDKIRSSVARNLPTIKPPFWGTRVIDTISLEKIFPYLNETVLIRGQWRVRQQEMSKQDFNKLLEEKVFPILNKLKKAVMNNKWLMPKAIYGYFPCQSQGNDLIVYKEDLKTEQLRFNFPRQKHGRHLCISDFFASVDEGKMDVLAAQVVTMGKEASIHSEELFQADKYSDYLYFHGLSVELAEAFAEYVHKLIRLELGLTQDDANDIKKLINQGYRGSRYSFGYPACPNLEDQKLLFELLAPDRIDITLTEEFQIVPEQSTSAIIVTHPEAKYFNVITNT